MAILLSLTHQPGLKLRQQTAHTVIRDKDTVTQEGADPSQSTGAVLLGKEWKFEPDPITGGDMEVPRDRNPRTQEPLSTYSVTLAYGLRNLVAEKAGKVEHLTFRNSSIRNPLRIRYQHQVIERSKKGDDVKQWRNGSISYLPAGQWGGVAIGDGTRAILDEQPT